MSAQRPHARDDVARGQRDVLHAGAAVELEDTPRSATGAALGGLVDRELDPAGAVCTTFDIRAEYSVLMSSSSKWTISARIPSTRS